MPLAHLRHYDESLCEALAAAAVTKLPTFKAHNISLTAWSFATLRYNARDFFAAMPEHVSVEAASCLLYGFITVECVNLLLTLCT